MLEQLLYITPLLALFFDAFGTIITQAGYVSMKLSQIDCEMNNQPTKSGFCSVKWILGFIFVMLGCLVHAGKSFARKIRNSD